MYMQLFYIPQVTGKSVILSEEESKHCVRVLRMARGHTLQMVDGNGNLYHGTIADDNPRRCAIAIDRVEPEFEKRSFRLRIAMAPTKNIERFEWFLEKCTEIGIDEITPIVCEHSERRQINRERLERVMVSAMKQSVKAYLPVLNELTPFSALIQNATEETKFIAYCGNFDTKHLKELIQPQKSVLILIGPEGDFTVGEVKNALSGGFVPVNLGSSRLRTETAGVYACSVANALND